MTQPKTTMKTKANASQGAGRLLRLVIRLRSFADQAEGMRVEFVRRRQIKNAREQAASRDAYLNAISIVREEADNAKS